MNQPNDPPPRPGRPYPGQPYPGQPYPGQPYPPPAPVPPPPRRGRGCGRLILTLLLLAVVAVVVAGVLSSRAPERAPDTGTVQAPGALSVFDLRAGDCYNTREAPPTPGSSQRISVVDVVPCTSAHTDQVVAKISYGATETREAVLGKDDCAAQFQDKLAAGVADDPTVSAGRIVPADAASWTRFRVIACIVISDKPVNRSLVK